MTTKALEKEMITLEKRLHVLHRRHVGLKKTRKSVVERTAGALKGKLPKNPVAWQRKVRAEWD